MFTPETGIEVDLSIMPDVNKLVLANAAGTAPDAVIPELRKEYGFCEKAACVGRVN